MTVLATCTQQKHTTEPLKELVLSQQHCKLKVGFVGLHNGYHHWQSYKALECINEDVKNITTSHHSNQDTAERSALGTIAKVV